MIDSEHSAKTLRRQRQLSNEVLILAIKPFRGFALLGFTKPCRTSEFGHVKPKHKMKGQLNEKGVMVCMA